MRTALLFILLFQAQAALAQFWPTQNQVPYNQVVPNYASYPGYGGYGNAGYGYGFGSVYSGGFGLGGGFGFGAPGYGVMPGRMMPPPPWFRQPSPFFQQPYNMYPYNVYGGGYGGFGPPPMFPNQAMSPLGMMGQPRTNLNLFLNLDQLFGGGAGGFGTPIGNGEPYCEYCESRRHGLDRIRVADDYDDDRDYDRPTHTEARTPYVRQSDNYPGQPPPPPPLPPAAQAPANTGSVGQPTEVPGTGGGEHVAGSETAPAPAAPARVVRPGKELPPAPTLVSRQPTPGVGSDLPNPNPSGEVMINVSARDKNEIEAQRQPFFKLFMYHFSQCVPAGCEPANYAIDRKGAQNHSCHGVDAAIDVHAIVCNKDFRHPHWAVRNDPLFNQMVACMGGVEGGLNKNRHEREAHGRMGVIWHQPKFNNSPDELRDKHWDHAHFSPREGCILANGTRYW